MHPCQLLLMFSCLWLVDGKTPSTSDPHNRRSHWLSNNQKNGRAIKGSQPKDTRIPKSVTDTGCIPTDGTPYTGNVSTTESGLTCQMWSVDTPHEHSFNGVGEHNYCRSPDGKMKVWCYITDPGRIGEYCDVPSCVTYTKGIDLLNIFYRFIKNLHIYSVVKCSRCR